MGKREAAVFFYIQADRLAEEKVEKDAQTLTSVKAKAPSYTLANIAEVVKKDKLFRVEAKVLVGTLAETEMWKLHQTLADLEAKALVDTVRKNSGEGRNILQHLR